MERGLFCLCPTWSVVLINQNFSINVSLRFASGSEETLFQMHSHYCTLVGDSCRDSGRVLAKRIKEYERYINVKHGTIWHILTHSEEAPHSDAGKCRAWEEYLGKGKARFDPWQQSVRQSCWCLFVMLSESLVTVKSGRNEWRLCRAQRKKELRWLKRG